MARRLAVGLALLFGLLATSAHAANTLTVSNNNDSGAGSLRQALIDASPGDTIVIPANVSEITLTSGALLVNKSVTVEGAGAATTVISANNASRVLDIEGPATVSISDLSVEDGRVAGSTAEGGGVLVHNASLTLSDSAVVSSTADATASGSTNGGNASGGGVASDGGTSTLTLIDTTISDNKVLAGTSGTGFPGNADGGGVFANGPFVMRGGALEGNTADVSSVIGGGGAVGGGLFFEAATTTTDTMEHVRVRGNESVANSSGAGTSGGEGAGAGIVIGGPISLVDDTINLNTATADGGANGNGGTAIGGAILVGTGSGTIENTTITDNTATASGQGTGHVGSVRGGGVDADEPISSVNSTFDGNTAAGAGAAGVFGPPDGGNVFGGVRFENSIVADGHGGSGTENCSGNQSSEGHNIDSLDQCRFGTGTDDLVNTSPVLGPLQDNGGPVQTMALLRGSPAIDAADGSACPSTDARGVLRPAGGGCDIGAFEVATAGALTGAASAVGGTIATLNGSGRNPDLVGGSVAFQWGTTPAYGNSTAAQPIGPVTGAAPFGSALTGLAQATTYHFREIVTNALGTVVGADQSFSTLSPRLALSGKPRLTTDGVGVRFSVLCMEATCKGRAAETTVEHLRGRKLLSVSAKRRARTKKRTVTVGRVSFSLGAGARKTLVVKLNATGRKLERRFKKLPVKLTLTLVGPNGKASVVKTARLTLKPHKKRHKKSAR